MSVLELEGYLFASIGMNMRFFLPCERYLLFHCLFHNISRSGHVGISATLIPIETLRCLRCIVHLQQDLLCILLSIQDYSLQESYAILQNYRHTKAHKKISLSTLSKTGIKPFFFSVMNVFCSNAHIYCMATAVLTLNYGLGSH